MKIPEIHLQMQAGMMKNDLEVESDYHYDPVSLLRTMPSGPPDNGEKVLDRGRGPWNHGEIHWVAASGRNQ